MHSGQHKAVKSQSHSYQQWLISRVLLIVAILLTNSQDTVPHKEVPCARRVSVCISKT